MGALLQRYSFISEGSEIQFFHIDAFYFGVKIYNWTLYHGNKEGKGCFMYTDQKLWS